MKQCLRRWLDACDLRPMKAARSMWRLGRYWREYRAFKRLGQSGAWPVSASYPCLHDRSEPGGLASGHYFHQDFFVARQIYERRPPRHVDVGSRVDGFVTHVAVFCPVEYIDLRPIESDVANVTFRTGSLTDATSLPLGACDSLSCLHVIEHVGLGRYGDPLEPDGWRVALRNLAAMLRTGGTLYLSVPIGRQRVAFNAHRVFAPDTILSTAAGSGLVLERFAWIDDAGALHVPADRPAEVPITVRELAYGCGIFEFRKCAGS